MSSSSQPPLPPLTNPYIVARTARVAAASQNGLAVGAQMNTAESFREMLAAPAAAPADDDGGDGLDGGGSGVRKAFPTGCKPAGVVCYTTRCPCVHAGRRVAGAPRGSAPPNCSAATRNGCDSGCSQECWIDTFDPPPRAAAAAAAPAAVEVVVGGDLAYVRWRRQHIRCLPRAWGSRRQLSPTPPAL